MNILFINIATDDTYPTGIGAISAFLKKYGHKTQLINLVAKDSAITKIQYNIIKEEISLSKPKIVGFTVFETGLNWVNQISDFIKKIDNTIKIIAGGYYPTLAPNDVIMCPSIDIICRGEGEQSLLELVNNLENGNDIKKINNLWVKENGEIFKNEIRPLIENIDGLPFWDREMFDYQSHIDHSGKGNRNVKVMASRGCPYKCTYCSNFYFKELYPNKEKYLRIRSVDNVISELINLKDNLKFDYFGFHDDNLTLFQSWLKEFSIKYRQNIKMPFYCAARVETCSDENLDYLKEAGCFMVLVGIESGDEKFRKEKMNRNMSNELIVNACKKIKERNMNVWTFNMLGMPGETKFSLIKTIFLNWKIGPDFAMTTIYYPFKGTEMGDYCYKLGIVNDVKKRLVGSYANNTILNHPHITGFEMKIAKYLTTLSAIRSRYFFKEVKERIKKLIRNR
ncbi:MAG: radical SAM protein [Candidatus Ancaeobacter aquaticus]|nr:radical SAM protein [Candidatus Ancaeobacter aquaticus]